MNLMDLKSDLLKGKLLSKDEYESLDYVKSDPLTKVCEDLKRIGISNKQLAQELNITESYISKILKGRRITRDIIISISIILQYQEKEVNQILKYLDLAPLYVKNTRDQVIIFAINKGYNLSKTNALLLENNHYLSS